MYKIVHWYLQKQMGSPWTDEDGGGTEKKMGKGQIGQDMPQCSVRWVVLVHPGRDIKTVQVILPSSDRTLSATPAASLTAGGPETDQDDR